MSTYLYDRSDATNGQSLLCMESECGRCAIDDETYLNILDLEGDNGGLDS